VGLAQDLLRQAELLATYEGANPSQASLRRAVSTAYYALFHLLIGDAASRWQGSAEACTGFERGFQHGAMRRTSTQFGNPFWEDWHDQKQRLPQPLREVARAFVLLQDERHTADYDNHETWSTTDVKLVLDIAHSASQSWQSIRADPISGNYLLAMLLNKPRA
jgi:uncharacterized protein (UPF0332 family)